MPLHLYAPEQVLRRLRRNPEPPPAAELRRFDGAALWCDISGFTELTERLVARGPEGIEQLTRCLNRYFEPLIQLVHDHGGDIIQFEGDALLATWPAEEEAGPGPCRPDTPGIDGVRPIAYWTHHVRAYLAEVYRTLLRERPADRRLRDHLRRCARAAEAFGRIFPLGRPSGLYWRGVAQAAAGRARRALSTWRRCIALAEATGHRLELGLAHRELAAHLPPGEPTRRHHRERARQVLEAAGALYDLRSIPRD